MNTQAVGTGAVDAQRDMLLGRAKSMAASAGPTRDSEEKIVKAGKDFESILLGNWLQQAEQSFATVPGGDGADDEDAGKDQFQGIAMQALAGSLTASGGVGIAKMITGSLHARSGTKQPSPHPFVGSGDAAQTSESQKMSIR